MTKEHTILLVEDDLTLGEDLLEFLTSTGFITKWAQTAQKAQDFFTKKNHSFSIILMDVGLPDMSGIELAKILRIQNPHSVLFFLSAQNDPATRLEGLELGAHDYITKPFEPKELILRLNRALKYQNDIKQESEIISAGKLKIMFSRYQVEDAQGSIINLSQKECAILKLLYNYRGDVVHRDRIINEVWGENAFPSNRTVDNYIVRLRRWTDTDRSEAITIKTVRAVGYTLIIKKSG